MKKNFILTLFISVLLGLQSLIAGETATREECIQKVQEVVAYIKEKGIDASFDTLMDKDGPFVWKDSYVFVITMTGTVVAHPVIPTLNGGDFSGLIDQNGKMFVNEYLAIARGEGQGWVDYVWTKPGVEGKVFPKDSFVMKVPGMDYIAIAGYYLE
ncbi:MAG: cache domain-containing protein [Desulfamplus sp.]|nr:cache domain-containing protein [Desulfamplus sp.]